MPSDPCIGSSHKNTGTCLAKIYFAEAFNTVLQTTHVLFFFLQQLQRCIVLSSDDELFSIEILHLISQNVGLFLDLGAEYFPVHICIDRLTVTHNRGIFKISSKSIRILSVIT